MAKEQINNTKIGGQIAVEEDERYYEGKISYNNFMDSYVYYGITFPVYPGTDPSPSPEPKEWGEKGAKEVSR